MDKDDKSKSAKGESMKSEAMSKGGDTMKPRRPDVTGKPPMNSPTANTTPAPTGPGVNPNVEDKKMSDDRKKMNDRKKSEDKAMTK